MASLRYFEGAMPGKKRKLTDPERSEKKKEYEKHRKEREFNEKWRVNRDWLVFDKDNMVMKCQNCVDFYSKSSTVEDKNVLKTNTFINGCKNFRASTIEDHEKSKTHIKANDVMIGQKKSAEEKMQTEAGKILGKLKSAEKNKLMNLFRNAHAIAKHNRPLSDYTWLCDIDKAKQLDIGSTYINDKAPAEFIKCIARTERQKTVQLLANNPFFAFMMDGSTDISGDEQETIYIRTARKGVVTERFLDMSSPKSTKSVDLFQHVMDVFKENQIDENKLVGMGSDGASNMTGVRSGLSTMMRGQVNPEMINVHCLCHRLELAFRDAVKKVKLYDKLMTLLIGLYYFYKKSYKNKQGLKLSIEAMGKGVYPTKVTGTRWLPHLFRGIGAFLRTYNALEAHLSTASHGNPKGEGLLKLMLDKQLMAFILLLHDALEPAMRLSLKMQKPEVTLSDSLCWVESTIEMLSEKKERTSQAVTQLLESGKYQGITLKGATPAMKYADGLLQGFCDAISERFQTEAKNVINATKILNFQCWPTPGDSELKDYGNDAVRMVYDHFQKSLTRVVSKISVDTLMNEWNLLKKLVARKFGDLTSLSWKAVFKETTDLGQIMLLIDLMLTVPSTSVTCETAFSQLKLLKTCRRSRLGAQTLNDLMMVKLESPEIAEFHPESAVDNWLAQSMMGRRLTYTRKPKAVPEPQVSQELVVLSDTEEASEPTESSMGPQQTVGHSKSVTETSVSSDTEDTVLTESEPETVTIISESESVSSTYALLESEINILCDKDADGDLDLEEECLDFQDEMMNFDKLMMFSRD